MIGGIVVLSISETSHKRRFRTRTIIIHSHFEHSLFLDPNYTNKVGGISSLIIEYCIKFRVYVSHYFIPAVIFVSTEDIYSGRPVHYISDKRLWVVKLLMIDSYVTSLESGRVG